MSISNCNTHGSTFVPKTVWQNQKVNYRKITSRLANNTLSPSSQVTEQCCNKTVKEFLGRKKVNDN
jgi:hypothetical protein